MKWLARRRLKALDALVTGHRERDWRMGLTFSGWRGNKWALLYRMRGGFGWWWLPSSVQHAIVAVWNPIACRVWGHNLLDEKALGIGPGQTCTNCSKEFPAP